MLCTLCCLNRKPSLSLGIQSVSPLASVSLYQSPSLQLLRWNTSIKYSSSILRSFISSLLNPKTLLFLFLFPFSIPVRIAVPIKSEERQQNTELYFACESCLDMCVPEAAVQYCILIFSLIFGAGCSYGRRV